MKPSELDPARWRRIDEIFDAALDTPPAERAAFLAQACGGDHELRAHVEALLEASQRDEAGLDRPVSPLGAALIAAAEEPVANRQVGPFRLLREIGRGGMGVVYLAEDTRLGRHVALKALPPYLGMGRGAKRRFMAEAKTVSALDHPNIATLYEIGETAEGQLYMVFALYEGETLEARIARGPLPVQEAVGVATGIAEGLAAAHQRGIVHRDVKPSNVLLTETGGVKLLDFGVAKVVGEDLTGEGVRLGTLAYMSPEHVSGAAVDQRTDLWSLGVVLHEMLHGERPFRGTDQASLLHAILHDAPPPVTTLPDDLSKALPQVLAKLLSKAPGGRYHGAAELLVDLQALGAGAPPPVATREPALRHAPGRRWSWRHTLVAAGAVAAVAAGIWLGAQAAGSGARIERLAVLPLENLTGDPAQAYFVNGVHDALIAELGKISTLEVISRTSVMRYRNTALSVPEIAEQLGVNAVVEGSVFRDGDSLAITAQLIALSPERHLWAERYERGVGSVFEITSEVARAIAGAIQVALSPEEQRRLTIARPVDPDVYEAYTLGRFNMDRGNQEGLELAQRYFLRAIAIDSTFAPAYADLAEAAGRAAFFGLTSPAEAMPRIRALVETALALDSMLPEAHMTLGAVRLFGDWDWAGAEQAERRAIALNPSYASAYSKLSEVLLVRGRYREALDAVERGAALERMVPFSAFRPVVVLYVMGEHDQAIERARAGLEFFPDFWQGHWLLCLALAGKGLHSEAIAACEEAVARSGRTPIAMGALGYANALAGQREAARQVAVALEDAAAQQYVGGSSIAMVYAGLGDQDRAFAWLERAYEERDVQLVHLADYAFFDPLRADPRFAALLGRMGLEKRQAATED